MLAWLRQRIKKIAAKVAALLARFRLSEKALIGSQSMNPLDDYLQGNPPGYALLMSGEWGVGKSFYWTRYSLELGRFNLTPITISAAGLQNMEDLERALFQASISGVGSNSVREAGTVMGRALLRFVNIEPDDIKLKAEVTGGRTVICIDDVERFSGDFSVLFGFIVNVIDGSGAHCVLVADESKALERFPSYQSYKERIVGKTVRLTPDPYSFCDRTIRGFADQSSRDILLGRVDDLVRLLGEKKVSNLRTVRFVLTEMDGVIRKLPEAFARDESLSRLLSAVSFWAISTSRNSSSARLISKIFESSELGVVISMRQASRARDASEPDEVDDLIALLGDTKFSEEVHEWPQSQQFSNLVQGFSVDYSALAAEFGLMNVKDDHEEDFLSCLNNYRELSDEKVQSCIQEAVTELMSGGIKNLGRLFELYRTLYWLSKRGVFSSPPDEWTSSVVELIDRYEPSVDVSEEVEFWMAPYDEEERRVISAVQSLAQRVKGVKQKALLASYRSALLSGHGEIPESVGSPLFEGLSAEAVFDEINAVGSSAILRVLRLYRGRMRVMNSPDFVGGDRDFSEAMADLIEERVEVIRPLSVQSSLMLELAENLRSFVRFVDSYRAERQQ